MILNFSNSEFHQFHFCIFSALHIAGSALELRSESIGGGVYSTEWNTTGSDVTVNRKREYITVYLQVIGYI